MKTVSNTKPRSASSKNRSTRADFRSANFLVVLALIVAAAAMRILPHPSNFVPMAAIGLFGGAKLSNRFLAVTIVLCAMFLSDLVLGFHGTMVVVYPALALITLFGSTLGHNPGTSKVAGAAIAGSVVFFILSNLGVWLIEAMYPMTAAGLATCFTMALPFFWNSLLADVLFSVLLFSVAHAAEARVIRSTKNQHVTA